MRNLFLTIFIPAALLWGLWSAPASILVLTWIWFQRPYDFAWGFWNTLPVFRIALAVALVSNIARGQFRPRFPPILVIYLFLMGWITLSACYAYDPKDTWEFCQAYLPSMWVSPILIFATVRELDFLKRVMWVAAGGIGINGAKVGLALTAKGGGTLSDQISGFVGDNNVFGLVLCLVIAIALGLRRTLPDKRWVRVVFYVVVSLIALCIVYTKSRGALLTLVIIILLRGLVSARPIRNVLLISVLLGLAYVSIPATYFDRLSSLNDLGADTSAMGRVQNWGLSWNEAVANPWLGVGPSNHIPYNRGRADVQVRVAHSVYFQVLGELGFPALILYLLFVFVGLFSLIRTWRAMIPVVRERPDLLWVKDLASWMTCAYFAYIFGSGLLNMLYLEFPWYVPFFGSMLWPMVQRELVAGKRAPPAATANTSVAATETTPGSAGSVMPRPRWRTVRSHR